MTVREKIDAQHQFSTDTTPHEWPSKMWPEFPEGMFQMQMVQLNDPEAIIIPLGEK